MEEVKLSNIIAPSFFDVYNSIKSDEYTHYWLKGGRGSTKSSFTSIVIILGMMKDSNANAVVLRKVSDKIKDSVYTQLLWAIDKLGVTEYWKIGIQPLKIIYKPTGQEIIFRGSNNQDDYRKIKSIKARKGYFKYVWFEEVDEFFGIHEIRSINQSLLRGGKEFKVFYTYNPPKNTNNWVNMEILNEEGKYIHTSTYKDVPKEWLGKEFIKEAERLKKVNELAYRNEYLGEPTGTGGTVFTNLDIREITKEELAIFDNISSGVDFGYSVDPSVYVESHLDKTRKRLYIYKEIYKTYMSNRTLAEEIKQIKEDNSYIVCDSAEPKSIDELKGYGLKVIGAKKGPDSVEYGVKWLQDLEQIIIDPKACPNTAREFRTYELEKDKNGNFKAKFPDENNHTIDAIRYSREDDMKNKERIKVYSYTELGI